MKIKLIISSILIILLLSTTYICHASDKEEKDTIISHAFEQRDALLASGKYQDVMALANKVLALKPGDDVAATAFYMRGEANANLGKYNEALNDFNKAAILAPNKMETLPPYYFNVGTIYLKLEQTTKAIEYFDMAIKLDEKYVTAYNHRGESWRRLAKYKNAITDFNKAIDLDPRNATAYDFRGSTFAIMGLYEFAIKDLEKAATLAPDNFGKEPELYHNKGLAYMKLGKLSDALKDMDKAIELNPAYVSAYDIRGSIYVGLGKHDEAIKDFNRAIDLNPQFGLGYFDRGLFYYSRGELDSALKDTLKAIELNPNNIVAHVLMVGIYSRQNDIEQACKWLKIVAAKSKEAGVNNWGFMNKEKEFENVRKASCYKEITK